MQSLVRDFRLALRSLARRPALALAVTASLALVIGCNTTVFSYLDFLLWQELPIRDPDRLVSVSVRTPEGPQSLSFPDYADLRDQTQSLSGLAGWNPFSAPVDTGTETVHAWGHMVTGNYFPVLGVSARWGRALTEHDDRPGAAPTVVISDRFWRRYLGADRSILGRSLRVNGQPFTVVGVTPQGFLGAGVPAELYIAMIPHHQAMRSIRVDALNDRSRPWVNLFGRLKPGIGIAAARAELDAIAGRLPREAPEPQRIAVEPAGTIVDPVAREYLLPTAQKMMIFVLLLLLLACANVANLLIASTADRLPDLGVRVALGAGRRQLLQQLLVESLLLSLLGGLSGSLIAVWGTRLIESYLTQTTAGLGSWGEGWLDLRLDVRVLGFTLLLCLATGLLAGLFPALQASSRASVVTALKGGVDPGGGWIARLRVRETLVVVQIALSAALLAGTGLFVRGLWRVVHIDPGFETGKILLASFIFPIDRGEGADERQKAVYQQILDEVAALPGVASTSLVWGPPLAGFSRSMEITAPERAGEPLEVGLSIVGPGYFQTLGIAELQGRGFDLRDREGASRVAVVNAALARRLWPGESPLGKTLLIPEGRHETDPTASAEVIGVVADARTVNLWEEAEPLVYLPFHQSFRRLMTLVLRTEGDPERLAPRVRRELGERHRELAVVDLMSFPVHLRRSLWSQRMNAQVVGIFGFLGLTLAALGLGSAMSFAVSRRTYEIGIRMALGARQRTVLWGVLRQAVLLVALGSVAGLAAILAFARVLASFIQGVETRPEPLVLTASVLVLLTVGLLASWHPARRAARIDPAIALKHR
ncbi:MAG TPA: ABC transporter permease [Thermoanaerobaculia bacterium]